jgi:exonuclease VII small subunit
MALARRCAEHLDQAELRVRQLQWGAAPAEASPFAFPEDQEPPF